MSDLDTIGDLRFMQDRAAPYFALNVHVGQDQHFPERGGDADLINVSKKPKSQSICFFLPVGLLKKGVQDKTSNTGGRRDTNSGASQ